MRELTHEGNKDNLAKTVNRSKVYIQFNKNTNQSITEVGKHRKQKQHKAGLSTGFKTKQEIQKKVQLLIGTCYLFLQCKEEWRLIFVVALEWIEVGRHHGNGVVGILYQQEVLGPAGRVMYQSVHNLL